MNGLSLLAIALLIFSAAGMRLHYSPKGTGNE